MIPLVSLFAALQLTHRVIAADSFAWSKLSESTAPVVWTPCYTNRECSKLTVPLDYQQPDGRKASIALVRKKATVASNSPAYRGPILFNPGGPGVSGVDFISGPTGDLFSTIVEALGQKKLQYWGFSYGSTLGATFAAMFPDRIERMVIDGVGDVEDYYSILWETNLLDSDKVLDAFFTECIDAGPTICPFSANATTPQEIQQKLNALYESVATNPIPVFQPNGAYGLIDEASVRGLVFQALYSPYTFFPLAGAALADPAANADLFFLVGKPPLNPFECPSGDPTDDDDAANFPEGGVAVMCNDGDVVPNDIQAARKYYDTMAALSQWGPSVCTTRIRCSNWPGFSKDRFRGPFVGNTSFPLLLIGNTADPITPLASAKNVSRGFQGSVVLTQNSTGHTSTSAPSQCTMQYVHSYFLNGNLPPEGTVCQVDYLPFSSENMQKQGGSDSEGVPDSDVRSRASASPGDMKEVLRQLSQMRRPMMPGLQY